MTLWSKNITNKVPASPERQRKYNANRLTPPHPTPPKYKKKTKHQNEQVNDNREEGA
jgi:hypothetical protein